MNEGLIKYLEEIKSNTSKLTGKQAETLKSYISEVMSKIPSDNPFWFSIQSGLDHTERTSTSKGEFNSSKETFLSDLEEIIQHLKEHSL